VVSRAKILKGDLKRANRQYITVQDEVIAQTTGKESLTNSKWVIVQKQIRIIFQETILMKV
jgi:hypothetical protein